MRIDPQEWRDVPGYDGLYQANAEGLIRRSFPNGETRILKACQHDRKSGKGMTVVVNMYCPDGKWRLRAVSRTVAETFLGPTPPGMVVFHKNGMLTDNSVYNLGHIRRKEFCSMQGRRAHKRQVVKIAKTGEVVEVYGSARQAAERNYISYGSMVWRCSGNAKLNPASDGYDYAWEDDQASIRAARKRLNYTQKYK